MDANDSAFSLTNVVFRRLVAALALSLSVFAGVGCGGKASAPQGDVSLATLTSLFLNYQHTRGEFPKDEAAFKAFIVEKGQPWLSRAGITDVNSLFTSTRDGQPIDVAYGSKPDSPANAGVIAYERNGVDGKRHVGFRDGSVRQVDDQELLRLIRGS